MLGVPGIECDSTLEIVEQSHAKGSSKPPSSSIDVAADDSNHHSYGDPRACTRLSSPEITAPAPASREQFVLGAIRSSSRRTDADDVPDPNSLSNINLVRLAKPSPLPHDQPAPANNPLPVAHVSSERIAPAAKRGLYRTCPASDSVPSRIRTHSTAILSRPILATQLWIQNEHKSTKMEMEGEGTKTRGFKRTKGEDEDVDSSDEGFGKNSV
ncbi:hypothetical protein IEQ34_008546 [Dendrobium chrysotoxum]|uniref:Uncharacterized protein n=1 Tax=Dendrobium chrysotoxum TaxID=161865 RepID=A0AAV7GY24_DENCH|nr:hypothetical protein IEQ34_008546 [Dendrobium chrysotoxum]